MSYVATQHIHAEKYICQKKKHKTSRISVQAGNIHMFVAAPSYTKTNNNGWQNCLIPMLSK